MPLFSGHADGVEAFPLCSPVARPEKPAFLPAHLGRQARDSIKKPHLDKAGLCKSAQMQAALHRHERQVHNLVVEPAVPTACRSEPRSTGAFPERNASVSSRVCRSKVSVIWDREWPAAERAPNGAFRTCFGPDCKDLGEVLKMLRASRSIAPTTGSWIRAAGISELLVLWPIAR